MSTFGDTIFNGVCAVGNAFSAVLNPRFDQPLTREEISSAFQELSILNPERADSLLHEFRHMTGKPGQYKSCVCPSELPCEQWATYDAKIGVAVRTTQNTIRERLYGDNQPATHYN